MDARNQTDYTRATEKREVMYCPSCGSANATNRKLCFICGTSFVDLPFEQSASEFSEAQEQPTQEAAPAKPYVEPVSALAEGLPEWTIEPPQSVVRRR